MHTASNHSILPAWRLLYDAAVRLKDLWPWEWMTESDVFGVEPPETGDLGFVSITGMLGEHYAVTVYLRPEALDQFWALQQAGPSGDPERVLEISQLQAWMLFRSFSPGLVPFFWSRRLKGHGKRLEQRQRTLAVWNKSSVRWSRTKPVYKSKSAPLKSQKNERTGIFASRRS